MIQINPDKLVRIELTPKERKTVSKFCEGIDKNTYDKIIYSEDGVVELLIEECHDLKHSIFLGVEHTDKPKIKDILGKVFNKLTPNPIARSMAEQLSEYDFEDIDEANEIAQEMMKSRNAAPDAEMGGLSPDQVSRLIYLSWDDDNFPLKFNKKLKLSELKNSAFFANTTAFLKTLVELKNENTATARGNLNRKFVKLIFDELIIEEDQKKSILKYNKVINEPDVSPLHTIRIVCESAGLIHKRKNKFLVQKKYQDMLSDERAGELFCMLFQGYFRKFNIGYVDRLPELDFIQHTVAYSIYRLGEIADSYRRVEGLTEEILLPAVLKKIRDEISEHVFIEWIIGSRIIEPLIDFGLVKGRYKQFKGYSALERLRKTELFGRFVRCKW